MLLIPGGDFIMGSEAEDAAPNERPLTPVTLVEFYMSRFPITNGQYEQFDPSHKQKRLPKADGSSPGCLCHQPRTRSIFCLMAQPKGWPHVSAADRGGNGDMLVRGTDERKYPWGESDHRGDLANFADASTTFTVARSADQRRLPRNVAGRRLSARRQLLRARRHGRKRLGNRVSTSIIRYRDRRRRTRARLHRE